MSLSELKTVINDIIDDYNLDILALAAIIIFGVYLFFIVPIMYVHTTEAVIDGHLINVTSRASGQILHSYIMKDQEVRKGDLLMEIDPKDYEQELIKLETDLEIYKEKLRILTNAPLPEDLAAEGENAGKIIDGTNNTTTQATENKQDNMVGRPPSYAKDEKNFTNYSRTYIPEDLAQTNLTRKRVVMGDAVQNMSDTSSNNNQQEKQQTVDINIPKPSIDKSKIDVSNDTIESVQKEIKNIQAMEEEVKLNLSCTKVFAPQDGIISGVSIAQGDIVNPSDVLCTLIPKQVWVIARVHPSQLGKIQVGQFVKIKVPGYKHRTFKGQVTSVDTTAKVYQVKADEQVAQVDSNGEVTTNFEPAYQIKIEFIEDYSDFNLPPDTKVEGQIKVKTFINQGF